VNQFRGFTLTEVLVSLMLLSIALGGYFALQLKALQMEQTATAQAVLHEERLNHCERTLAGAQNSRIGTHAD